MHIRLVKGISVGERLTKVEVESKGGWGHKVRYRLAAGFINNNDIVLDAACGIGYGQFLMPHDADYIGVDLLSIKDRIPHGSGKYIRADLSDWQADFDFDVGVSFETIEHLEDYSNLLIQLKKAKRWVICSVPVVPTVHDNEWHKHDFAPLQFPNIFEDEQWEMYQYLAQPQELSEIYIFKRRDFNG